MEEKGTWLVEMLQLIHLHLQICTRGICRHTQHRIEADRCPRFAPALDGREGEVVCTLEASPAVEAEAVVEPETVTILASSFIKNDYTP